MTGSNFGADFGPRTVRRSYSFGSAPRFETCDRTVPSRVLGGPDDPSARTLGAREVRPERPGVSHLIPSRQEPALRLPVPVSERASGVREPRSPLLVVGVAQTRWS